MSGFEIYSKREKFAWDIVLMDLVATFLALSGFMIAFTLSLDDFVLTQYLKEPSFETISTYIQKIVTKHPIPAEVRALTTLLALAVFASVIFITIYNNRKANVKVKERR